MDPAERSGVTAAGGAAGSVEGAFGTGDPSIAQRALVAAAGLGTASLRTDSHGLDEMSRAVLDAQARWLLANPGARATLQGRYAERCTREQNAASGERPANAAKGFLSAHDVRAARPPTVSWGKKRPAEPGSGEWA